MLDMKRQIPKEGAISQTSTVDSTNDILFLCNNNKGEQEMPPL